jgi:hypothetical protein
LLALQNTPRCQILHGELAACFVGLVLFVADLFHPVNRFATLLFLTIMRCVASAC